MPSVLGRKSPNPSSRLQKGKTPVNLPAMVPYLDRYPRREAARFLADGFAHGFRIPCSGPVTPSPRHQNLKSTRQFPQVVSAKLAKEVELGRMAGPFEHPPVSSLHVSPLGVAPKKGNTLFACYQCTRTVSICWVVVGRGSFILTGVFRWGSISCAYFEVFSTFVEWVVREETQLGSVLHDDFLCIGPPDFSVCSVMLHTLESIATRFGIPLAPGKTEGPSTVIQFLGIIIDTRLMECRLPSDKLEDLRRGVAEALAAKKVRLRQLQSLLGKLNFACRIRPMGRIFSRRLCAATAGVLMLHHFIRLSRELKADLRVWEKILVTYNGRSLWMASVVAASDIDIFTHAAGSSGFGAFCQGAWCAAAWPKEWSVAGFLRNLVLLKLFPIVVAVEIWGSKFRDRRVCFHCDNLGVVEVILSLSASSPPVVRLLRHLVLRCLSLNCLVQAVHVPGVLNSIADSLSRF